MLYSRQNNLIRAKTLTQEKVMIEQSGYLKVLVVNNKVLEIVSFILFLSPLLRLSEK